ncbi:MAG: helix-turn-helix transcriptional regulator [Ramlibacter sp.]|nr:helix-turn-helix transcriptional regulator [Ramlibacter sp.]
MPQHRTLLHETAGLTVERVVQRAQPRQWSVAYEVATARLVLPMAGATEFRMGAASVLLDPITVLGLGTGQPYQMKPWTGAARTSVVVSTPPGASWPVPADAWVLTPRALWLLRRHWRSLARGDEPSQPTVRVLRMALASACRAARSGGTTAALVQRAQRFMAGQLACGDAARWTLDDVAQAACCSPFHLAHSFRRHTGLSLHAWRQRLRLAAALQYLEDGESSLAALAHALGFSSQSHLGAVFQRELGVTPAQARRRLAG